MVAATPGIYTLSLHDALPILHARLVGDRLHQIGVGDVLGEDGRDARRRDLVDERGGGRSEEHTSELQSHVNLVCRLLLEKKKNMLLTAENARQLDEHYRHYDR